MDQIPRENPSTNLPASGSAPTAATFTAMTPLQDRGTRDHGNRQQEAELRGGRGSEAAPQGSAHGRPGTGDPAEHSRHGLREPDPHGDPDRRLGAVAAEPPRGPVHEPRHEEPRAHEAPRSRRPDLTMEQTADDHRSNGGER